MTEDDERVVDVLLDALDRLYDGKLVPAQLRAMMLGTKIDSAELSAAVHHAARALDGVLRLDARVEPPFDARYAESLQVTRSLRSRLADLYDEIWASRRRW
ncbi:MAG TPA: hypothetical protein VFX59_17385 [Polyangiales bacterium]|nr:hypothetical protein [Polyangiales bacterium]